jgi:TonB family protein
MLILPVTGLWKAPLPILHVDNVISSHIEPAVSQSAGVSAVHSTVSAGTTLDWGATAGLGSLLISLVFALRWVFGYCRAGRIVSRSLPITDVAALRILNALCQQSRLRRVPPLLVSDQVGVPIAFGWWNPRILLPSRWTKWPACKLKSVLAHEVSHVARGDGWVGLAAVLNRVVFWFHPLSWWLEKRLAILAEMACDDYSVMLTDDRDSYVETLFEVAKEARGNRLSAAHSLAMARTPTLSARIDRLLGDSGSSCGIITRGTKLKIALAAFCLSAPLALVSVSPAQQEGFTLSGVIQDPSGARIPEATVIVRDAVAERTEMTTGSPDGSYRLAGLPASENYLIEVQAPGFAAYRQDFALWADSRLNLIVEVGEIREAIVIAGKRPPAPSADRTGVPTRVRVGGNVQKAKLVQQVRPVYPADAEIEGVQGTVLLQAVISKEGEPLSLRALNRLVDERLIQAAVDAVRFWQYEPTRLNGQPVEVVTTISVAFRLEP